MENYSKIINDVVNKLDWEIIMKYYEKHGELEEEQIKRKRVQIVTKSILTVKKELKDLVKFAIDSNLPELQHDNWILHWENSDLGCKLEIVFAPTRASASDNFEVDEDALNSDIVERDMLTDMLNKSVKEENFELSQVIFVRLKKLEKIISLALNKKSDIY